MSKLLAAAFHESVSVQALSDLFKSDLNQLFAGTTAGHCARCGQQFAVFFPSSDDPKNLEYLKQIEDMIAKDCRDGKHVVEIKLQIG